MLQTIKKLYINEQFNPKILSLLISPSYLQRKFLYNEITPFLSLLNGKLLDIGCGTKPYKNILKVNEYIGLEINKNNPYADIYYDGKEIPLENETFDSILSSEVFEHVFNPNEFLQEANRVLKQDGLVLITVPFVWDEHEQPFDYARYTSFGLEHILNKNGFKIIKSKKIGNGSEVIFQMLNSYFHKITLSKKVYVNFLKTFFLIAPTNIIGLIFSKLLPRNNDLYLGNIVLAKKINTISKGK